MQLTAEEYVENKGAQCPFCLTDRLEKKPVRENDDFVYSDVECLECGAKWVDILKLVEFVVVNPPRVDEEL